MEQQVFRFSIEPARVLDWLLWKSGINNRNGNDAVRIAERYGLERSTKQLPWEMDRAVIPLGDLLPESTGFRPATLLELVAFTQRLTIHTAAGRATSPFALNGIEKPHTLPWRYSVFGC